MKRHALIGLAALIALTLGAFVPSVAAASEAPAGLGITPRKDLVVKAGQTLHDKLRVSNLSKTSDLRVNLEVVDFTYSDGSGTPKLLLDKDSLQTAWSLKPFITLPASTVVPAGQTKVVNYTINIPKGQEAGSYYSAITYTTASTEGKSVNLKTSGVSLLFVSVPGLVDENLQLLNFGAFQTNDGEQGSTAFINTSEPKRMAFVLKNQGRVAESPSGTITIEDTWGDKVRAIKNINPEASLAIIGQSRQFTVCIKQPKQNQEPTAENGTSGDCPDPDLSPGRYTATLDLFYGQNGNETREIQATITFWYVPWWVFGIAVAIIILFIAIILWIRRKILAIVMAVYIRRQKRADPDHF